MREETMREEMGDGGAKCTEDNTKPGNNFSDETRPNLGVSQGERASIQSVTITMWTMWPRKEETKRQKEEVEERAHTQEEEMRRSEEVIRLVTRVEEQKDDEEAAAAAKRAREEVTVSSHHLCVSIDTTPSFISPISSTVSSFMSSKVHFKMMTIFTLTVRLHCVSSHHL